MSIQQDQITIEAYLQPIDPRLSAKFNPAEDESVDDDFTILRDGEETGWSIQMGYRYYAVNFWDAARECSVHYYSGESLRSACRDIAARIGQ